MTTSEIVSGFFALSQVLIGAYWYGRLSQRSESHEARIQHLEDLPERVAKLEVIPERVAKLEASMERRRQ